MIQAYNQMKRPQVMAQPGLAKQLAREKQMEQAEK